MEISKYFYRFAYRKMFVVCLKCKYLMMCSPCIVVNYLSTGDYNTPAETVCQLTHLRVNMCNSID